MKKYFYVVVLLISLFVVSACVPLFNNPPNKPSNPYPVNGASNIPVNVTLQWQASDPDGDTLKYDLYFGEQSNPPLFKSNLTSKSYGPLELENDKTYYWKVVAKDPNGKTATGPVWSFSTIALEPIPASLIVVSFNTGSAVEGATVVIKNGEDVLARGTTNEKGEVTFNVRGFPEKIDVELKKQGYALSKIEGLKVEDIVDNFKEVQLRTAKLSTDPDTQTFPEVTLSFFDLQGNELDITNITGSFTLRVDVETDNHPSVIYAKIGSVPGSGSLGERYIASDTKTATFTIDISNFYGENPLYVVFYDYNDNRVEKIEYITITKEIEEVEGALFVPISPVDFGYVGIVSYTRNQGVEFYNNDKLLKIVSDKFDFNGANDLPQDFEPLKNFGTGIEAAPQGTNLWIEISWFDYDTLYYYGLVGPNVVRPDGYNVYRSFDGVNYRKIATVGSGYYLDPSAQNEAGKEVWYAVTSYKGNEESELVKLGSVVPLDSFNVNLRSPADRETNVSRQPTFVWEPTKELISPESVVEYYYTMWVYDLVQSENYIFPGILEGSTVYMYDFATVGAAEVSVTFKGNEGSPEYEDLSWFLYLPSGIYYYGDNKLEAGKTYDWGVDYAYAVSYDSDSLAYSIAIDYGWGIDPFGGVMPEMHNEFTTGNN
ncbi:hypothetical protein [Petrotoga sp. 9PWA.NaAc.5.4]|uniref:hypothetical protein n=1 Tax=Petrotoga sp. 9PWA.NaAc.5.4 TaxID=1434328 RepID=UPI000CC3A62C|nr:hypothetical protein [Petrotoga sp. 9PWA.NaAc.5.4]PNR97229.1 hypothetical protein X924_00980 [Petrotoga sp. 9PWA.NaAc.5.4]